MSPGQRRGFCAWRSVRARKEGGESSDPEHCAVWVSSPASMQAGLGPATQRLRDAAADTDAAAAAAAAAGGAACANGRSGGGRRSEISSPAAGPASPHPRSLFHLNRAAEPLA